MSTAWRLAAVLSAVIGLQAGVLTPGASARASDQRLVRVDGLIAAGELDEADTAIAALLEESTASGDDRQRAGALRRLAALRRAQQRIADVERALIAARDIYASHDAAAELGIVWRELGSVYWHVGRQEDSSAAYLEAARAFADAGRAHDQAGALRSSRYGGRYATPAARRAVLLDALALVVDVPDTEPSHRYARGTLLHDIGDDAFSVGQYADADRAYRAADALLAADAENRRAYSLLLTSRGRLERAHGYPERALPFYERAAELQRATAYDYGLSQTFHALGTTYAHLQRYDDARRIMEASNEVYARVGPPWRAAVNRIGTANVILQTGDVAGAVAALDAHYAVTSANTPLGGVHRLPEVKVLLAAGRVTQALDVAEFTVRDAEQHGVSGETRARALLARATVFQRLGRADEALADLARASDVWESMRRTLAPSDYVKRGFAEVAARSFYPAYVEALARAGAHARALEAAELARARAFADLLAQRQIDAARTPRAGLDERTATPGLAALQRSLLDTARAAAGSTERAATVSASMEAPSDVVLDSLERIAPLAAPDMRRLATEEDAIVAVYWQGTDETLLWVLRPAQDVVMHTIAITGAELTRLVADASAPPVATAVRSPTPARTAPRRQSADVRARARLFELLVAPFARAVPHDGRLIIVPHGPLARLSFATLVDGRGRYLVERASVQYTPSLTALHQMRQTPRKPVAAARAVVVGEPHLPPALARDARLPPLPGARVEAAAVARILEGQGMLADVLTGVHASEQAIRERLGRERPGRAAVVHLAAHGVISDAQPMASFIALAGAETGQDNDGMLTAAEVYGLHLDADLVVLSACRTADGPVTGDGISGLTRAFFAAGTRSVIASFWDLPDETSQYLLPEFYRAWRTAVTGDKPEALRRAQLRILADLRAGRLSVDTRFGSIALAEHPSLWGGLALIGSR